MVAKDVLNSGSAVQYLSVDQIQQRYPQAATEAGLRFLIEHMCFDISKAETILGYCPRHSSEAGLTESLRWCMEEGLL